MAVSRRTHGGWEAKLISIGGRRMESGDVKMYLMPAGRFYWPGSPRRPIARDAMIRAIVGYSKTSPSERKLQLEMMGSRALPMSSTDLLSLRKDREGHVLCTPHGDLRIKVS